MRELVLARRDREKSIEELDSDDPEENEFSDSEEPTAVTVVVTPATAEKPKEEGFPLWGKIVLAILSLAGAIAPTVIEALTK